MFAAENAEGENGAEAVAAEKNVGAAAQSMNESAARISAGADGHPTNMKAQRDGTKHKRKRGYLPGADEKNAYRFR